MLGVRSWLPSDWCGAAVNLPPTQHTRRRCPLTICSFPPALFFINCHREIRVIEYFLISFIPSLPPSLVHPFTDPSRLQGAQGHVWGALGREGGREGGVWG